MGLLLHTLATAHPVNIGLNLVSMPGTQLATPAGAHSPDLTLFKSHKALPRRQLFGNDFVLSDTLRVDHDSILGDDKSYKSSERIRSWIPELAADKAIPQSIHPLTPPSTSKGDAKNDWENKVPLTNGQVNTFSGEKPGITTPVNQGSPPTPDITPPHDHRLIQGSASSLNPPSQTGSFVTAREDQLSDDDLHTSPREQLPCSHRNWLDATRSKRLRDVGLGLKLDTEDKSRSSHMTTGRVPSYQDHATLGIVGMDVECVHNSERGDQLRDFSNVTFRRRHDKYIQPSMETQDTSPETAEGAAVTRGLSLRERVEKSRHSPPSASTERFAEQIEWPKDDMSRVKPRETENRRFSQLSATSTIVEAMVIPTPPQRKRTLRHTGKITAFPATGSPVTRSNCSSLLSDEQSHRQMLRKNKSPDAVKRSSIVSDTQFSAASTSSKSQPASIPVAIIPQRRSSLKSSSTRPRHESKVIREEPSDQQKLRPATAPEQYVPIMDRPRPKLNALVPLPLAVPRQPVNDQFQALHPPPLRRFHSSPPPLSGNMSRESTGNPTHLLVPSSEPESRASPMPQLSAHSTGVEHYGTGEWSALRPASAQITPFSLRSARSSTPGAFEVSEATAVSIYPHNNNSILVVQQMSRVDSSGPDVQTTLADDANIALTHQTFPSVIETPRTVASPLKNPREPPRPPAFAVIPPTPSDATPIDETSRGRTQRSPISKRLGAPITTIKRALSARRFSEPTMSDFQHSAARHNEVRLVRPGEGPNASNKLHPFWRPRGFWDDFSDGESEFGNDGLLVGNVQSMRQRDVPVQKTNIPRSMSLGNRFRKPFRSLRGKSEVHKVRETSSDGSMRDTRAVHPRFIIDNRKGRNQGEWVGLTGLKDRYMQNRREKEEQKREKERAKLRNSIGHIIVHPHTRVV